MKINPNAATCSTLAAETSPYLGQQPDQASIGRLTAWVREGFSCRAPLFEIEPLLLLIDE
jgi:hypothetical protein